LVQRFKFTPANTSPAATSGTNRTLLHPSGSVPLNVTHDPLEEQLLPAVWRRDRPTDRRWPPPPGGGSRPPQPPPSSRSLSDDPSHNPCLLDGRLRVR
jgi:hypothetical protein